MSAEISIKKATLINACAKYSNVLFMLVANAVLARLLSAEEYGILAIITVFVTFFQLFSDMGFSSGVIQNKELTGEDISNIFSFTLYFGVVLGFLFFILSFFIAQIYQNKVFVPIGAFLSIAIFFSTANMIPSAQLMRDKQFIVAATRSIAVNIVSYVIAIILAFHNFSFYSLVAQSVIAAILNFCWNYSTTKIGFKVVFEIKSIRKIFSYSAYNFLYEFVNYFGRNLDNLLTGKYMGSQTLGYYNKTYQLMLYPVNYKKENCIVLVVLSLVLFVVDSYLTMKNIILYKLFDSLMQLTNALTVFVVANKTSMILKKPVYLQGTYQILKKYNFAIYLFHQQIIYTVITILNGKVSSGILFLLNIAISIVVSIMFAMLLSKNRKIAAIIGVK